MATDLLEAAETPSPPAAVEPDDLYEVIGSEIVEKKMGVYEVILASLIHEVLAPYARSNRLGLGVAEMIFDLRPHVDRQRRPDAAFVSAERWPLDRPIPRRTAAWAVVPDLAVEVVSPTNMANEVIDKVHEYFRSGVRLVWVVYPEKGQVYVYESTEAVRILSRGGGVDGGDLLPGFRLALDDLFGPPEA